MNESEPALVHSSPWKHTCWFHGILENANEVVSHDHHAWTVHGQYINTVDKMFPSMDDLHFVHGQILMLSIPLEHKSNYPWTVHQVYVDSDQK